MEVQALDAAAPASQLLEQAGLLDGDLRVDEEGDGEAEPGGPLDIAADEPFAVRPAFGSGRGRVRVRRRRLHIHRDDDMQLVHGGRVRPASAA